MIGSALRLTRREPAGRPSDAELRAFFDPRHADLRSVLDGLIGHPLASFSVRDIHEHRYVLVNSAFAARAGRPKIEILGRTGHELFPPEIADHQRSVDEQTIATGKAITFHERLTGPAGRASASMARNFPILGFAGDLVAVGTVSVDVSEIEAEHKQAVESETRFRTVFEHADIGQLYSTPDGVVALVNGPMAGMLGYQPSEMIGHPTREFVCESERSTVSANIEALRAGAMPSQTTFSRFRHRDGHEVSVALTNALLRDADGSPRMWVSMARDVTDQERAAEELKVAHAAAVAAADRLRVVHAIATSSDDATSLEGLAHCVVSQVCDYFGWQSGALLRWRGGASPRSNHSGAESRGRSRAAAAGAEVAYARNAPWAAEVGALLGAREWNRLGVTVVSLDPAPRQVVVVALTAITGDAQLAWVFDAEGTQLEAGELEMLSMIGLDSARVIDREVTARQSRESELHFRSVFHSSPLAMGLTLDDSGVYAEVNAAFCELVGRDAAELVGRSMRDLCHPDDMGVTDTAGALAAAAADGRHQVDLRLVHSSGDVVQTVTTLTWMSRANGSWQLMTQMEDVTARRAAEDVMRRQAEQDDLTGLLNRSGLSRALEEIARASEHCAVLFIDLDGFKLINDTRGHEVGDEVLKIVADRLRRAVRPGDVVARFGGDEFVAVCRQSARGDGQLLADQVADRIESTLRATIVTTHGPARVTSSIGMAEGRVPVENPQSLVRRADAAMYHAKRLGKDRRICYDAELHRASNARRRTESALRNALADDRFALHFQPIMTLDGRVTIAYEALVRLVGEDGKLVSPEQFITVAEQSGLIVPMGAWVIREACRTLAAMRAQSGWPLHMSVNIAARQAARPDLADTVLQALETFGLPPDSLVLELTESALLEADARTIKQLLTLRELGVGIALDDFGTGYSSLTYLRRLPVTALKIDRSFVSGIVSSSGDLAIVRAVTRLAADLDLKWVAEGIETAEQRDVLSTMGPGLGQGYYFGRPGPANEFGVQINDR